MQHLSPTRVMINTAAVLFVLAMAWILIQIRAIVALLLIGILFAAAIEPLVYRLRRRGLTRGQAIMVVYVALVAAVGVLLYLVVPSLTRQATKLFNDLPLILDNLRQQAINSDNEFIRTTGQRTMNRLIVAYYSLKQNPPIEGSTALQYATSVIGFIFTTISVMIIAFYWMTEKAIIKRIVLGLLPFNRRDRAHALWDQIEYRLGGWTRGQLVLCLTIGALSTIGYFLLGLQFWLALGILAGITEIIPFIGPFLGGGTAVAIAFTESWQKALAVAIFAVVLQQLEGAFLVPRIMRNAVGMTPLTVILAVLVGGSLGGPLGAVLAIPVGAAVQVLVQDLLRSRAEATDSVLRNLDDWSSVVPPDVDELPRPNLRTRSVNDHAQVSPASVDSSPVTR
ncbi:MAG TPA: AI-2E family transporter [Thermomicrobiales bacterium]|nr:AI-2E family transporter [Thermomicrobiales bacterium]